MHVPVAIREDVVGTFGVGPGDWIGARLRTRSVASIAGGCSTRSSSARARTIRLTGRLPRTRADPRSRGDRLRAGTDSRVSRPIIEVVARMPARSRIRKNCRTARRWPPWRMPIVWPRRPITSRAEPSARVVTGPESGTVPRAIDGHPAGPAHSPMGREAKPARRPAHSKAPTRPRVVAHAVAPRDGSRIINASEPPAIAPPGSVNHHSVIREGPAVTGQIPHIYKLRRRVVNVNVLRVIGGTTGWNVVDSRGTHVRDTPWSRRRRCHIPDSLFARVIHPA
jgi:hypothetical protein